MHAYYFLSFHTSQKPIKTLNVSSSSFKTRYEDSEASMTYVHLCSLELLLKLELSLCIGYYGVITLPMLHKVRRPGCPH